MFKLFNIFAMIFLLFGYQFNSFAEVIIDKDTTKWQSSIDGIEIEWDSEGAVKRIYSLAYQPIEFSDRRGLSKGYDIASLKARAAIVRFLGETISSDKTFTEVQTELNSATQNRGTNGNSLSKTDQRTMSDSLQETISSVSKGNLRGVITLEKGFDEKNSEVWVKVGISNKTKKASIDAQSFTSDVSKQPENQNIINLQKNELKKSKNLNDF